MNLGSLVGGMAEGAHKELSDQNARAFQMKLMSAQMDAAHQNAVKLSEHEQMSENAASALGNAAGIPGLGRNKADQAVGLGMLGNQTRLASAGARLAAGANRGMTVADFEDARGIKTGMDGKRWLNPSELRVWESRIKSETPTTEVMNSYKQQLTGSKLLDQVQRMRTEALKEVFDGPIAGRAANLAVAADNGKLYPKAKAYLDFAKINLAGLSHFSGEVSRLAEGDIDRARPMAPGFGVATESANILFDSVRESAKNSMATSEELFPQLRRMRETEAAGQGLKSKIEQAVAESSKSDPQAKRARFAAHQARLKAQEDSKKNQAKR